jgi:hypothetical protein
MPCAVEKGTASAVPETASAGNEKTFPLSRKETIGGDSIGDIPARRGSKHIRIRVSSSGRVTGLNEGLIQLYSNTPGKVLN